MAEKYLKNSICGLSVMLSTISLTSAGGKEQHASLATLKAQNGINSFQQMHVLAEYEEALRTINKQKAILKELTEGKQTYSLAEEEAIEKQRQVMRDAQNKVHQLNYEQALISADIAQTNYDGVKALLESAKASHEEEKIARLEAALKESEGDIKVMQDEVEKAKKDTDVYMRSIVWVKRNPEKLVRYFSIGMGIAVVYAGYKYFFSSRKDTQKASEKSAKK